MARIPYTGPHTISLVRGPEKLPTPDRMTDPVDSAYCLGWNDALAAVEAAQGVGLMYRCLCGSEWRAGADADEHIQLKQREQAYIKRGSRGLTMPCYTERTITVELQAENAVILDRALRAAGFTLQSMSDRLWISKNGRNAALINGTLEAVESQQSIIGEIKRTYAAEVVRTAAQRFGFTVTQDKTDAAHVTLQRRSF